MRWTTNLELRIVLVSSNSRMKRSYHERCSINSAHTPDSDNSLEDASRGSVTSVHSTCWSKKSINWFHWFVWIVGEDLKGFASTSGWDSNSKALKTALIYVLQLNSNLNFEIFDFQTYLSKKSNFRNSLMTIRRIVNLWKVTFLGAWESQAEICIEVFSICTLQTGDHSDGKSTLLVAVVDHPIGILR